MHTYIHTSIHSLHFYAFNIHYYIHTFVLWYILRTELCIFHYCNLIFDERYFHLIQTHTFYVFNYYFPLMYLNFDQRYFQTHTYMHTYIHSYIHAFNIHTFTYSTRIQHTYLHIFNTHTYILCIRHAYFSDIFYIQLYIFPYY